MQLTAAAAYKWFGRGKLYSSAKYHLFAVVPNRSS